MPGYGRFETVEQVASSGPFTLYSARPAGEAKPPELAIKVYEGQAGFIGPAWERKAAAFLESASTQKALCDKGAKRWAPIFAAERTEDAAYYVSRLYALSAKRLMTGAWQRTAKDISWVAGGVVSALIEIRDLMGGRAHGNLHGGNVLIGDIVSGAVAGQPVVLTDPAPTGDLTNESLLNDQIGVGRIIFELVMRREAPRAGGFALTTEWTSLGPAGRALHEIADTLMSPAKDPGPLEQVRDRILNLPADKGGNGKLIGIGAAAVLLLGGGAAFMLLKSGGGGGNGVTPPPPPPPPAVKTGACLTRDDGAGKWFCAVIEEAACKERTGRYFGDGFPCAQPEYLIDPREEKDWPGQISPEDTNAWLALQTDAKFRKGGIAEFTRLYLDPLEELNAAVEVSRKEAKWVPGYVGADMSLSSTEQARIVAAANKIKADFASFSPAGERFAAAKAAIGALAAELDQAQITGVLAELAKAETRVEELRVTYGDEYLNSVASFATLGLGRLRTDLEELKRQAAGGEPTPEQIKRAATLTDRVRLLPEKMKEVDADLRDKITDILRDAADSLSEDIPAPLRTALTEQIAKLTASDAKPSEKLSRAQAATYWASQIRAAFEVPGLGSLDGVFDATVFEALKGTKSKAAVDGFARRVASLPMLPARDDTAFRAELDSAAAVLKQWSEKVSKLTGRARQAKDLLDLGFGPDEKDGAGASIDGIIDSLRKEPEWAELSGAFKPLEDAAKELNDVARGQLNEDALLALIPAKGANAEPARLGRMLAAWARLSALPGWPASFERLSAVPAMTASLESNIDVSKNSVERKNKIKGELGARRLSMWTEFVGARLPAAQFEAAFSEATRRDFGVTDQTLAGLKGSAAFNWALLRAKAEAASLTDAQVSVFVGKWAAPLDSEASIKRAFEKAAQGKFGTEWSAVGPGAAGWALTSSPDAEDFAVYRKGDQTLYFKKVTEAGGMVCTTEATIGLVSDLLDDAKLTTNAGQFVGAGKPTTSEGPSPWYFEGGRINLRKNSDIVATRGWIAADAKLQGLAPFAPGVSLAEPTPDLPMNWIGASAAMVFAQSIGCRLPTVEEWGGAARAGGEPNLRDATFSTQCSHAQGLAVPDATFTGHFPSGGRFPVEGGVRRIDPKQDCTPGVGNDGFLFFRPVPAGTDRFVDVEGNVAEWVLESAAGLDASAKMAVSGDRLVEANKAIKDIVGVIGGSALSPSGAPRDRMVKGTSIEGFSARGSFYSDVGFRLAFTAEGGGGGGSKSPADWVRRKLADVQFRNAP